MRRRDFLAAVAGARLLAAAPARWNLILIVSDDLGWTDLACYGSQFYETPNLDRLAREGMRFTNAYAACPVCSPTRAALMTGKYPARLGLTDWIPGRKQWPTARLLTPPFQQQLPLQEVTIAEALKPAGYTSASIGKWHLGGPEFWPEKQGFDLNVAGTERGSPKSYFGPFDLPNLSGGSPEDYLTDRLTDEAIRFIEANRSRPFFLYLPHFAVHIPLQAKPAAIEKYRAKVRPEAAQRDPVYAAMIESMDEGVGRLMKRLEELGLAERTVVIFTSDNGGLIFEGSRKVPVTSNHPLRAGKGHLYEGGIRVPLIVRWPGVTPAGSICDYPVSSQDIFPTLAEMAGVKTGKVDGLSLCPLLRQRGKLRREALYWHYPHYSNQGGVPGGAVRAGDWKLIEFYEDGRLELYNLREDVAEKRNLVRKFPQKAAELHAMLRRWRQQVGARMPQKNPNYDPAKADQGLTGAEPPTPPVQ